MLQRINIVANYFFLNWTNIVVLCCNTLCGVICKLLYNQINHTPDNKLKQLKPQFYFIFFSLNIRFKTHLTNNAKGVLSLFKLNVTIKYYYYTITIIKEHYFFHVRLLRFVYNNLSAIYRAL